MVFQIPASSVTWKRLGFRYCVGDGSVRRMIWGRLQFATSMKRLQESFSRISPDVDASRASGSGNNLHNHRCRGIGERQNVTSPKR